MPKRATRKEDPPRMRRIIFGKGKTTSSELTSEEIAKRAYEIYLERGGGDGHADDDWLLAEQELSRERGQA